MGHIAYQIGIGGMCIVGFACYVLITGCLFATIANGGNKAPEREIIPAFFVGHFILGLFALVCWGVGSLFV